VAEPRPLETGAHGHGCGHNLLGSAALLAATGREGLARRTQDCRGACAIMAAPRKKAARAKAFHGARWRFEDATSRSPGIRRASGKLVVTTRRSPTRAPIHLQPGALACAPRRISAAAALDAVELMNVGVNYMREQHAERRPRPLCPARHGGIAPNVVQAHARVRSSIRARRPARHERTGGRVHKIAQGAALMTETKMEMKIISAVSNILAEPRRSSRRCMASWKNSVPRMSTRPTRFRRQNPLHADREGTSRPSIIRSAWIRPTGRWPDFIVPLDAKRNPQIGSTDVGDVSWVVADRAGPCPDGCDR